MRLLLAVLIGLRLATPALAADQFQCAQIPHAQKFLDGLKPGPNTSAAQRHLDAAKSAHSDQQCVAELKKVDYYARRSLAADQRAAKTKHATRTKTARRAHSTQCADGLHQSRPGGSDYKGRPVAACTRRSL